MTQQAENQTRIDVREAIRIAQDYINNVYAYQLPHLLLEEVEESEDGEYWYITFGFDTDRIVDTDTMTATASLLLNVRPKFFRAYKLITVRASDGKVMSMKIREI